MKLCVVHVNHLLAAALTAGSAYALAAGMLTPAALAQTASARATIAGTHPAWANESKRISAARVSSGTVSARVYLAGQDPAGLSAVATAVSPPDNALYGHYLSPEEVRARFGPSGGAISAGRAWLTGAGLTVTAVDDRVAGYVEASGSVQAATEASVFVTPPFTISISPTTTQTIGDDAGVTTQWTITVTGIAGYTGTVEMSSVNPDTTDFSTSFSESSVPLTASLPTQNVAFKVTTLDQVNNGNGGNYTFGISGFSLVFTSSVSASLTSEAG